MNRHDNAVRRTFVLFGYALSVLCTLAIVSCATNRHSGEVNRKQVPQIQPGVAHTSSEIRDLAHLETANHSHVNLHFSGQLFVKSEAAAGVEIKPCVRCVVTLKDKQDTTSTFNMITEDDGYFEFFGSKHLFSFTVTSPNGCRIEIDSLDLTVGGRNHMVIINAVGSDVHKFTVTRKDRLFSWAAVK